jgi:NADH-quinone oxidoreductase subunit A
MLLFTTTFLASQYAKLAVFFLFSLILSFFILFLSLRLTAKNPDSAKLSTYECGFEPYEDARDIFDVRFYLVAVLFLVFDLETVFFFPWIVSISNITNEAYLYMIDFILELIVGYIYAWKTGALDWS